MGHEIPNNQTIFQFKSVVKNFLRDNKDNGKCRFSFTLQVLLMGRAQKTWGWQCSSLTFVHNMNFPSSSWHVNVKAVVRPVYCSKGVHAGSMIISSQSSVN